jgi:hypothetical protein
MKNKLIILFLFLSFSTIAQQEGAGKSEWTTYKTDPCFKQLSISFKCDGYSKQTSSYWYNIKFKNSSNQNIPALPSFQTWKFL